MMRKRKSARALAVAACVLAGCSGDESRPTAKGDSMTNRLALEKSPYLLQHADNPVDWYPWGEDAFERARREDKPVFLSIGYSTCHWCHVMEHESFEDSTVAAAMNDAFVCIKVDREERPDIDNIYMTVCQMMTGRGGWPLTIVMTPDRRPFFAATYLPAQTMLKLCAGASEAWRTRREQVLEDATGITDALAGAVGASAGDALDAGVMRDAYDQLAARYDSTFGGFGAAPKFPSPHNILFLLRYWARSGDPYALEMVSRTLDRMSRGGIYDQVGDGFHRYSTDQRWLLPHFEKMLYDQAMLTMAYTEAFQAMPDDRYRQTALGVIEYVTRDLSDPGGGFYSAEDADSDGEEGKFYVWTEDELRSVLNSDDADLAVSVYGVETDGNFVEEASREGHRSGANVLHLDRPLSEHAADLGFELPELQRRIESIRARLFEARGTRVRPGLDDKVLADWNGLMIAGLAKAARVFGDSTLAGRARRAADFVHEHMSAPDGGLFHRYRGGECGITGMIDDYAFVTWGLLELYEATFDVTLLERAVALTDVMLERFWDDDDGALYFTAADAEELIVRQKEIYDGAVPSGNSVAMLNLVRLARMTGRSEYEDRAVAIGRAFAIQVRRAPAAHTQLMCGLDFLLGPSHEVVIVGRPGS
ncbi:MAG TPA: thioredoxin domain-containing protein, partial [Halothiobacillaceae bacterium]|nr:thioredoxin domain-containing protein [Halothiobacillaceae bacterium]